MSSFFAKNRPVPERIDSTSAAVPVFFLNVMFSAWKLAQNEGSFEIAALSQQTETLQPQQLPAASFVTTALQSSTLRPESLDRFIPSSSAPASAGSHFRSQRLLRMNAFASGAGVHPMSNFVQITSLTQLESAYGQRITKVPLTVIPGPRELCLLGLRTQMAQASR